MRFSGSPTWKWPIFPLFVLAITLIFVAQLLLSKPWEKITRRKSLSSLPIPFHNLLDQKEGGGVYFLEIISICFLMPILLGLTLYEDVFSLQ